MTGYTVHTGASKKFVSGWDRIFGEDDPKPAKKSKKKAAKASKKVKSKKKK